MGKFGPSHNLLGRIQHPEGSGKECSSKFIPQCHMCIVISMPKTKQQKKVMSYTSESRVGIQQPEKLPEDLDIDMDERILAPSWVGNNSESF